MEVGKAVRADRPEVAAGQPIPGSVDVIQTPDKANAVYSAGFAMPMDDLHPDYPSMYLVNHTLGGTGAARLFTRVRGKEGLSYGVYSHFNASALDPVAQIQINPIFNPGVVEGEEAILEECRNSLPAASARRS